MTARFTAHATSRRHFLTGAGALLLSPQLPAQISTTPDNFAERDDVRAFCAELAAAHGFDERSCWRASPKHGCCPRSSSSSVRRRARQ